MIISNVVVSNDHTCSGSTRILVRLIPVTCRPHPLPMPLRTDPAH